MITCAKLTITCDWNKRCHNFEDVSIYDPDMENEYRLADDVLKSRGWIVTEDGEHICPDCAGYYQREQDELAREAERDAMADDPRNAPGYARYVKNS